MAETNHYMANKTEYSIIKRVDEGYGCKKIDLSHFRITRPTVIAFGGNMTKGERFANFYIKTTKELIDQELNNNIYLYDVNYDIKRVKSGDIDYLSIVYGDRKSVEDTTGLLPDEAKEIAVKLLAPLCTDEKGERLPLSKSLKNFSLITFVSHCAGSKELDTVCEKLSYYLQSIGYASRAVDKLLGETFLIAYAPKTFIDKMPSVHFYSTGDRIIPDARSYFSSHPSDSKIEVVYNTEQKSWRQTYKASHSIDVLGRNLITDYGEDEHSLFTIAKDENGRLMYYDQTPQLKTYSDVFAHALCVAVRSSLESINCPKPRKRLKANEVFEDLKSFKDERLM